MNKFKELADAIREGCKSTGQMFHAYESDDGSKTCATGAACRGVGVPTNQLGTRFPVLMHTRDGDGARLVTEIVHRNDDLQHTREAIADWVEHEAPKEYS